jgi:hypothetical protein
VEQGTQTNEVHVLGSTFIQDQHGGGLPLCTGVQHQLICSDGHYNPDDSQLKLLNDEIIKLTKFRVKASFEQNLKTS